MPLTPSNLHYLFGSFKFIIINYNLLYNLPLNKKFINYNIIRLFILLFIKFN